MVLLSFSLSLFSLSLVVRHLERFFLPPRSDLGVWPRLQGSPALPRAVESRCCVSLARSLARWNPWAWVKSRTFKRPINATSRGESYMTVRRYNLCSYRDRIRFYAPCPIGHSAHARATAFSSAGISISFILSALVTRAYVSWDYKDVAEKLEFTGRGGWCDITREIRECRVVVVVWKI